MPSHGPFPPGIVGSVATYDPIFSEPGGVDEYNALTSELELTSAGISSPADISTSSWTKSQCTAASSTGITIDVGATTPSISQNINNCGAGGTCVPVLYVFKAKYTSIQWLVVESRSATAANLTFFDVQNGVVGTNGANHTNATISAADVDGFRTIYLYVIVNGSSSPTLKLEFSTTDAVVTIPAALSRIDIKEDSTVPGWIKQDRIQQIFGRVSNKAYVRAIIDEQPGYGITPFSDKIGINGKSALRSVTTQRMICGSNTALNAAFTGSGLVWTVYEVWQWDNADLISNRWGMGNSANAANGSKDFGSNTTGTGTHVHVTTSDAAVAVSSVAGAVIASNTSPKKIMTQSDGTQVFMTDNGSAVSSFNPAAHNPGAITPNQSGLFCRPGSTQTNRSNGRLGALLIFNAFHDAATKARVTAYLATQWGF